MTKYAGPHRNHNKEFTDRQLEILPYIAQGKSDREISKILGVRHSTIYQHVEKMMDVVKCAERADLEVFCREVVEDASSDAS